MAIFGEEENIYIAAVTVDVDRQEEAAIFRQVTDTASLPWFLYVSGIM
jgi:hypothetical protein